MKLIKHLITITKHRNMVVRLCFKAGIGFQGLFHDLSKYSWTELRVGAKYYTGTRSPNAYERDEYGYSSAWLHHKGRNKHHFEYWVDFSPKTRTNQAVPMPLNYLVESLCDRIAACKVYKGKNYHDGSALDYFEKSSDSKLMHPQSAEILRGWMQMLESQGEKATLRYVKGLVKDYKKNKKK